MKIVDFSINEDRTAIKLLLIEVDPSDIARIQEHLRREAEVDIVEHNSDQDTEIA